MSGITPNMEQFAALAAAAAGNSGKVVMLNLLKFPARDAAGAKEYQSYGDVATKMVERTGGHVIYVGRCDQVLIGDTDGNDWDAIAVVEYPSRQAFIDMVAQPEYRAAHGHREAGLVRTVLIATTPTPVREP
jgi:uncharacterized protein (DUF1330 family)